MRRAGTRTGEAVLARSREASGALLKEALFRPLYAHFRTKLLRTSRHDTDSETPLNRDTGCTEPKEVIGQTPSRSGDKQSPTTGIRPPNLFVNVHLVACTWLLSTPH